MFAYPKVLPRLQRSLRIPLSLFCLSPFRKWLILLRKRIGSSLCPWCGADEKPLCFYHCGGCRWTSFHSCHRFLWWNTLRFHYWSRDPKWRKCLEQLLSQPRLPKFSGLLLDSLQLIWRNSFALRLCMEIVWNVYRIGSSLEESCLLRRLGLFFRFLLLHSRCWAIVCLFWKSVLLFDSFG